MANPYRALLDLLPADPLLIGEVTAHNADGTSVVTLPDGATIQARGQSVPEGSTAFVQSGEIRGAAPDLPSHSVDV